MIVRRIQETAEREISFDDEHAGWVAQVFRMPVSPRYLRVYIDSGAPVIRFLWSTRTRPFSEDSLRAKSNKATHRPASFPFFSLVPFFFSGRGSANTAILPAWRKLSNVVEIRQRRARAMGSLNGRTKPEKEGTKESKWDVPCQIDQLFWSKRGLWM